MTRKEAEEDEYRTELAKMQKYQKPGKWIIVSLEGCYCDKCGKRPYPFQADSSEDMYWEPDFCPHCGDDKRGGLSEVDLTR